MDSRKIKNQEEFFEILTDPDMSLQLERFYEWFSEIDNKEFYTDTQTDDTNSTPNRLYSFTNEHLDGFFENIDMTDKSLLTVGSSFDQALYSIFKGSTDVTVADLNMYAKFYGELKMAAIKNLSFEEFERFFVLENRITDYIRLQEDWKSYAKLSHDLSKDTQIFWDTLMFDSNINVFKKLFHFTSSQKSCFYWFEEDYLKLQNILKTKKIKTNFITAEFSDFPKKVDGKFDLIMLSNIRPYYCFGFYKSEKEFYEICKKLYDEHLKLNGLMQIDSSVYISGENKYIQEADFLSFNKIIKADKIFVIPDSGITFGSDSVVVQKLKEKAPKQWGE